MTYEKLVDLVLACRTPKELAVSHLRYEAVRKLTARKYSALNNRNLKGENFDDMVDEMVKERGK